MTNLIHFKHFVQGVLNLRAECVKDTGVKLDRKTRFHCPVKFFYFSQALKILVLIFSLLVISIPWVLQLFCILL